jgi:hypothetical protein
MIDYALLERTWLGSSWCREHRGEGNGESSGGREDHSLRIHAPPLSGDLGAELVPVDGRPVNGPFTGRHGRSQIHRISTQRAIYSGLIGR